ncbi:MAG: TIGR00282 family metallophosphoesterase [Ruminococcaceae bacterium]|nr:TIGR00282 family metallophosphoesterase [Oscillospiraceae bacterium]
MNILAIGDIVGSGGVNYTLSKIDGIIEKYNVDFVIANAENSASGNGITKEIAQKLINAKVDVITLGNHAFSKKDVVNLLLNMPVIRPINYPEKTVGEGFYIKEKKGKKIAVINAMGRLNLLNIDCPFKAVMRKVNQIKEKCDIIIVDFHAEATSEKIAFANYLDSDVCAVFGTHTHVQTADERILPGGTAYITDIGMTGPIDSILGVKKDIIIRRFLTQMPEKFYQAEGKNELRGVVFEIDDKTNKCVNIVRVKE